LKDPPSASVIRDNTGAYSTTSTSLTAVDNTNLRASLTTTGGKVEVYMMGQVYGSTTLVIGFDILIDGTTYYYNNLGFRAGALKRVTTAKDHLEIVARISGLSAAAHTFDLAWNVNTGTGYLESATGTALTDSPVVFFAVER
jgi:hypothetical protein